MSSSSNSALRLCHCGKPSPLVTSMTESNPGRRFWGCYNFPGESKMCSYFVWEDSKFTERSKLLILEKENKRQKNDLVAANAKIKELEKENNAFVAGLVVGMLVAAIVFFGHEKGIGVGLVQVSKD